MLKSLKELDRLLRGEATRLPALSRGEVDVSPSGLSLVIIVMGIIYGACMGCYALFQMRGPSLAQFVSTMGKVPLLFLLTLIVTFPSLYVFNALVGSRLHLLSVLRLIIATLAVMLAILASLGPIVAFFSISTTSYQFMLLLNVAVFAVSGFLGLKFLLHTLHRLSEVGQQATNAEHIAKHTDAHIPATPTFPVGPAPQSTLTPVVAPKGALEPMEGRLFGSDVTTIFRIWIVVFGLVGSQMGWVLRPFLGNPQRGFTLFSPRESNFFEAVWHILTHLS